MFIQTEDTPNPLSMKFIPGRDVLGRGQVGMDFPTPAAARRSPLALALFDIDGVGGVFLGGDFLTVTRAAAADWGHLRPAILGTIADYLAAGMPVIDAAVAAPMAAPGGTADAYTGEDREIVEQILELLETRVRPSVAQDGGDIVFDRWIPGDGIVYLRLKGACSGCPSSTMTLKSGIENLLRHYVPEVTAVEAST